MPYQRNGYYQRRRINFGRERRRYYRPKRFIRGRHRTGGYYGRFKRGKGYISPPEHKFNDVTLDDAVVSTTGDWASAILQIPEGAGEEQRTGRKIVVKSIDWKLRAQLPATSVPGQTSDLLRMMVVLDKQANGAVPAVNDYLETADFQSFNNLANSFRFKTLWSGTYVLNAQAGAYDGVNDQFGNVIVADVVHLDVNVPVNYADDLTTGIISTIRSNNILLLAISQSGLVGLSSEMRVRFDDA